MTSRAATLRSTYRASLPRARPVLALARRDYLLTRSYRNTFLLEILLGIINLAVYYFISKTFAGVNPGQLQGAPSYFDFAAVGIIMTVVIGSTSTEVASRVREEQLTGTLETLFIQPLTTAEVGLGLVGVPFLFAMARATIYLAVAAAFMGLDVSSANWIGTGLTLLVTGGAMAALGIAGGAFVLVAKRGDLMTAMILFAMGFVSGAVFPVSVLPDWVQPIGKIVPTRFAFDGVRDALFQGSGWFGDVLALALFVVICLPLAIWLFAGGLDWSKRRGSLAQY
jgi:ABC-2 type transport system permease protein